MAHITIVGYEQQTRCEHCGKPLKHGIRVSTGQIVGADCFDKHITKAKIYSGKKYRIGAEKVRELAKAAQFWSAERRAIAGLHPHLFVFEAVDA
jgi:hypothetical protein